MRLTLAVAALRRHRARTLLATLGVAVSAAMLLDMVMLSGGMRESFRRLLASRGFQLRLAPKGTLPFDTDATIGDAVRLVSLIRTRPEVEAVSPVLGGTLHFPLARGRGDASAFALGVIPSQQGDYALVAGRDPAAANELVANDDFLHATGARIGETLRGAAGYDAQLRAYSGARALTIVGRARFLYLSSGQPAVALPLSTLQEMRGRDFAGRVSLIMVRAREGTDVDGLARWIAGNTGSVTVISTREALVQVDRRLSYFRQLAAILGAVSLLVGFLLVTTLVTVSVSERVGEIGVLRAIGVSRAHVVQQVLIESALITGAGTLLGMPLGLGTARYLNGILSDFPGLPAAIDFFLFQPRDAWTALSLLALCGVAAGVYPAWRAAGLPIGTTLRREAIA